MASVSSEQIGVSRAKPLRGAEGALDTLICSEVFAAIAIDGPTRPKLRVQKTITYRQRLKRFSARRTISLSTMAMAASMAMSPNSLFGWNVSVNMVVKWPMPAVET